MKAKAILMGLLAWVSVSVVFGVTSGLLLNRLSPEQQAAIADSTRNRIYIGMDVVACCLAGYVVGRVSRTAATRHAAVAGLIVVVVLFVLPVVVLPRAHHPLLTIGRVVRETFEFACVIFGGWLASRRNLRLESIHSVQPTAGRSPSGG
jgi:hypothetical protein